MCVTKATTQRHASWHADLQGGEDLNRIIIDAMSNFLVANPLHSDVFPAVRKMESEIISMCLNLFKCPEGAGTSGFQTGAAAR